jgi:hypothetical protein
MKNDKNSNTKKLSTEHEKKRSKIQIFRASPRSVSSGFLKKFREIRTFFDTFPAKRIVGSAQKPQNYPQNGQTQGYDGFGKFRGR